MASKMLRGAGLSHKDKTQVLFNCGGIYDPARMETVLCTMHAHVADSEQRRGVVRTTHYKKSYNDHKEDRGRPAVRDQRGKYQAQRPPYRPPRQVHEVHRDSEEEPEEEEADPPETGENEVLYEDLSEEATEEEGGGAAGDLGDRRRGAAKLADRGSAAAAGGRPGVRGQGARDGVARE